MRYFISVVMIILILGGCAKEKKQIIVKYQYIYLPCKKEKNKTKSKSVKKKKVTKKIKALKKKKKIAAKEPFFMPKPSLKIYAPKRYIKIPNKKMYFMVGYNKDKSKFIYMEGEFGVDTYEKFLHFINKLNQPIKEIKINSNGGVLSSALKIGKYVHDHKFKTGVDDEMRCYSACGFVYFAGVKKSIQGRGEIGLHRPYVPGVADTMQSINQTKKQYIKYWNYIKAPKSLYDEMMEVDRDDLFLLNKNNIDEYIDVDIKE
jgi:ATP-dependent protease ClpP protease subunit